MFVTTHAACRLGRANHPEKILTVVTAQTLRAQPYSQNSVATPLPSTRVISRTRSPGCCAPSVCGSSKPQRQPPFEKGN